jgi:hypothetical protein
MNRSEILSTADQCISHDRHATYGSAEDSLGAIAALWSADLRIKITAVDVARLMVLMKMARAKTNYAHTDSWVDAAGYAALAGEMATKAPDRTVEVGTTLEPKMYSVTTVEGLAPGTMPRSDTPKMYQNTRSEVQP